MKHYAKKIDKNQPVIVEALRKLGATVQPMHTMGEGFPDLLVGFNGKDYKIEIKNPEIYGKPSDKQIKWASDWTGSPTYIVWTVDEAVRLLIENDGQYLIDGKQTKKGRGE